MAKKRSKYSGTIAGSTDRVAERNLSWALIGLLACTLVASASTVLICQYILDSFQDSHAMAGLITDSGLVFDDKHLEGNLSSATLGLRMAKDFGLALVIGVLGVGIAVLVRLKRQKAS